MIKLIYGPKYALEHTQKAQVKMETKRCFFTVNQKCLMCVFSAMPKNC